jgi:type II restriction enzyme
MEIGLDFSLAESYHSAAQRARVVTESWAASNMYCVVCPSRRIEVTRAGSQAIDFLCPRCEEPYQLKSCNHAFGTKVVDGAYAAMVRAISAGSMPHLLLLEYSLADATVCNMWFVPRFAVTKSCLEQRPPLRETARRAGWVGCNIVLRNIPSDARIDIVSNGRVASPCRTRAEYRRTLPLAGLGADHRGWTLDVLNVVRELGREHFSLADVYAHENHLTVLHPSNHNIQPKIRQQLQVLRDLGFIEFVSPGQYRTLQRSS